MYVHKIINLLKINVSIYSKDMPKNINCFIHIIRNLRILTREELIIINCLNYKDRLQLLEVYNEVIAYFETMVMEIKNKP
jgi:hypothetical protein